MTFAHVGGLPLEEGLLALAPAASALAVVLASLLRRVGGCLRRSPARAVLTSDHESRLPASDSR